MDANLSRRNLVNAHNYFENIALWRIFSIEYWASYNLPLPYGFNANSQ
jgi:hypothetical protein